MARRYQRGGRERYGTDLFSIVRLTHHRAKGVSIRRMTTNQTPYNVQPTLCPIIVAQTATMNGRSVITNFAPPSHSVGSNFPHGVVHAGITSHMNQTYKKIATKPPTTYLQKVFIFFPSFFDIVFVLSPARQCVGTSAFADKDIILYTNLSSLFWQFPKYG